MKKRCIKCNFENPAENYHKKPNSVDGLDGRCKSCVSKYKKLHKVKLNTKKKNQIHVSSNLPETMDVSADFYVQLLKRIGGKT